jgi:hypothetical protein
LVNNAIRQLMAQLKDFQAGTAGDNVTVGGNLAVTGTSAFTGAISAPMTAGTIDGVPIGGTTPAAGAFTTLAASGTTTLAGALVGAATQAAFNTVSTTLNLGGAATAVNIGAATGTATVANTTLAAKAITASTTLAVTGASTLTGAVTASSTLAVTGAATLSSTLAVTGVATLGNGAVLGTPTSATLTNATGLPISTGVSGLGSNVATFLATPSSANLISAVTDETGTGALVFATSPTLVTPLLGTPTSGVATNLTGLPISTGVSGLGTGVATLLATPSSANLASAITDETGSGSLVFATSPTLVTPALGTPSSGTLTNATGLPIATGVSGLGTGVATFLATPSSANLISAVTDETGTGSLVFATSPTLVTPILGTPTSGTLTNATGLPISTGVSGLGTGVATFLATPSSANLLSALTDETGTGSAVFATSPTLVTPLLGTPTSGVATNLTGLPLTTGVTGQLPVANGGTGTATPSIVAGTNVTVTGTWPNQTIAASGGGGSPGGSTTQVQYNNAGAFGGITGATTNGTALTLVAPVLGTPASGTVTNLTGTASININGTVGATTPSTGAFTTLSATGVTTLQAGTAALPALTTSGDTNTGVFFPAADSVATTVAGVEGTRLTSTGLGIGTSSPVANFRLTTSVSADTTAGVYIENTSTGTSASAVARYKNSGTVVAFTGVGGTGRSSYAGLGANVLAMYTDSNAGLALTVDNTGGSITFNTNSAETARINQGGNLLVGTTTATAKFNITNGSEQQISQYINNTNSSPVGLQIRYGTDINATANRFIDCIGNATSRFIVYSNGNVVNTNNSYGAISDVKLKESIVDASPKLADLMQVKVRNYNLKADPTHKQLGVIAQELETIFPAMVEQSPDTENVTEIDEDGNNIVKNVLTGTYTKSVKYSVFVPMLIKAIQEQQALITALTQRITALEGN